MLALAARRRAMDEDAHLGPLPALADTRRAHDSASRDGSPLGLPSSLRTTQDQKIPPLCWEVVAKRLGKDRQVSVSQRRVSPTRTAPASMICPLIFRLICPGCTHALLCLVSRSWGKKGQREESKLSSCCLRSSEPVSVSCRRQALRGAIYALGRRFGRFASPAASILLLRRTTDPSSVIVSSPLLCLPLLFPFLQPLPLQDVFLVPFREGLPLSARVRRDGEARGPLHGESFPQSRRQTAFPIVLQRQP